MKVIFDASVLGMGYRNSLSRTGVFRVVENLAFGLANSRKCDLILYADSSPDILDGCLEYLNAGSLKVPLLNSRLGMLGKFFREHKPIGLLPFGQVLGSRNSSVLVHESRLGERIVRRVLEFGERLSDDRIRQTDVRGSTHAEIFHSPFHGIQGSLRSRSDIKKFLTVYDLIPLRFPQFFPAQQINLVRNALSSLSPEDWILAISESTKNDLCDSCGIHPAKIVVTHLAASADVFYPCTNSQELSLVRKKYHIPDGPYLLILNTFEPRKNVEHVIKCFARLIESQSIRDLSLVLVGERGWHFEKIFELIADNPRLEDRTIITGYAPDADLAALYSGSLAFVYPSFYEGFGLPPLEAMQCGVPVITSNTSSLPEVVGKAGIMLDPRDTDGLCQSIFEIYSKPALHQSLSEKSLEQAKKFSWQKTVETTIAAYEFALNGV